MTEPSPNTPGPGARPVHAPLGAWTAVLLRALLPGQALTGLFANEEILDSGPLARWLSLAASNRVSDWHGGVANLLIGALALHVGAAHELPVATP